jgi:hypothetical protein
MDRATRVGQHPSMIKEYPKIKRSRPTPRGKASQSVKLVLAGIMAVGTPMSAGSVFRDRVSTYGCKRLSKKYELRKSAS